MTRLTQELLLGSSRRNLNVPSSNSTYKGPKPKDFKTKLSRAVPTSLGEKFFEGSIVFINSNLCSQFKIVVLVDLPKILV